MTIITRRYVAQDMFDKRTISLDVRTDERVSANQSFANAEDLARRKLKGAKSVSVIYVANPGSGPADFSIGPKATGTPTKARMLDQLDTLTAYLIEAHASADEYETSHYGDADHEGEAPEACTYCLEIEAARNILRDAGRSVSHLTPDCGCAAIDSLEARSDRYKAGR